jgi:putative membrane protein
MMWDDDGGRWGMMGDHDGAGWVMVLLMLVFVVAVVVAVVVLLRGWSPASSAHTSAVPRPSDPRAILQERLARGEIDEPEFRARMRALDETGG